MVINGLDILLQNPELLKNRRIGLIANQTSVSIQLEYSWTLLRRAGVGLTRIFSPEHGLFAVEQDQIAVGHQPDTGCEIVSLYGDSEQTLAPARELLEGLDLVLFDIQDVGSRYYTYVNTLALFMEAAEGLDIEIMVLDRPNPLGGAMIEGPQLDPAFHSFVGVIPAPVRHGLTAGEIAHFYRDYKKLDLNLSVVTMQNWAREMLFPETGLPWVPPSPNMPTFQVAEVYPGMCLFEGLNVSEGRGTTTPFLLSGAPFVDPFELAARLTSMPLEGGHFQADLVPPDLPQIRQRSNWRHLPARDRSRQLPPLRHGGRHDLRPPGAVSRQAQVPRRRVRVPGRHSCLRPACRKRRDPLYDPRRRSGGNRHRFVGEG